jgi:hypothetical protein
MNNFVVFTLSLLAIGLCTLHFCCGYWLAESRRKKRRRPQPASAREVDRVAYQAAVNTLLEHVFQACAAGDKPNLAELGRAAKAVERSASSFDFQPTELRSLTLQPDGTPLESEGYLCSERRPYPTWQYMAPYGESLPDPKDFQDVFCHDISVGGISYLAAEAPTYGQICISVGSAPNWILLEATVANYRCVEYKGMPMYLIGCRFSRRLGSFSEVWPGREPVFGQPVSIRPTPATAKASDWIKSQPA